MKNYAQRKFCARVEDKINCEPGRGADEKVGNVNLEQCAFAILFCKEENNTKDVNKMQIETYAPRLARLCLFFSI